MAIVRGFFQHDPQKNASFSIDEIRTLLRGAFSKSNIVSDFEVFILSDTLSCFASVGLRALKSSKIGHARRMDNFTCKVTLNDEYLSRFLSDCKVLLMTGEHLVEIFTKPSIFDSSRAICVLLWPNQLLVPSG